MTTNKNGFSLLELVIGIMISTILITAALTIYNQIGKGAGIIQKITTNDTKIMILRDRIGKDLAGISHRWFSEKIYEDLKKTKEAKKPAKKEGDAPKAEPKNTELKKENKKIKSTNFFLSAENENGLNFLTFITTNAMQMYGETKACFVRIVYKVVPEINNPKAFRLMRKQEEKATQDINKEKITEGAFYELAGNISKLEIEYGFTTPSKQELEKNPDQKIAFKWIKKWNSEPDTDQKKEFRPLSPEAIKLNISFLQAEDKPEIINEIVCVIPQLDADYPKSFAQKRSETEKKTEAPKGDAPKDNEGKAASDSDIYRKEPNGIYNKDPNGSYRKVGDSYMPISNALQAKDVTKAGGSHA